MKDKFLSADIFRVNSSASSRRTPRDSPLSARSPAESAERSPDVRWSPPENYFGRSSPDPRRTRRSLRVSARNCGGRSSAEPIAEIPTSTRTKVDTIIPFVDLI